MSASARSCGNSSPRTADVDVRFAAKAYCAAADTRQFLEDILDLNQPDWRNQPPDPDHPEDSEDPEDP